MRFVFALACAAAALSLLAATASAAPGFTAVTAKMSQRRYAPAVATLPNGNVLVAGGYEEGRALKGGDVFNVATGGFETLGAELLVPRGEPGFSPLPNGEVLIAGGTNLATTYKTAELYNPTTNRFEATAGEMTTERDGPGAALLHNGKVLITGGAAHEGGELTSAELYNPGTGSFEALPGEARERRYQPVAATLPSGKVLIAGGYNEALSPNPSRYMKSAELFNPETGAFEAISAELNVRRDEEAYTPLQNGNVLIAGGFNETERNLKQAEIFNVTANRFEAVPTQMTSERDGPAAALLHNGRVLIVGGYNESEAGAARYLNSAELTTVNAATVATAPATGVGMTTATLNGSVLTEEVFGTAFFQYGTGPTYGSVTTPQSVLTSLTPSPSVANIAGLSPNTTYHFRLVTENAGGVSYGADQLFTTAPAPATVIKPVITGVHESRSRWREGRALAQISKKKGKKKAPVGTTFSLSLNAAATVTLQFSHSVPGRRVGRKCEARTHKNAKRKSCKRTVSAGTLTFAGHTGSNRVVFQGRISRSKRLKPGRYTVTIVAKNAAGQSNAARLTFTIVK